MARISVKLGLALTIACVAWTCAGRTRTAAAADVALGEEVDLGVGQLARFDGGGLTVRFLDVPHDSRCPVDVQCITAGNAVARLRLAGSDGGGTTAELNTTVGTKEVSHAGYRLRLVALRPEPTAGIPIRQTSYRAIVQATRG